MDSCLLERCRRSVSSLGLVAILLLPFSLGGATYIEAAPIWDVVNQVDQASYTNYLVDLLDANFQSYPAPHENDSDRRYNHNTDAQAYIHGVWDSLGLDVVDEPFSYGGTQYNVVAKHEGLLYPEKYFVVGAHYDSVSYAPGADDNGSGTVGVMEAARVLSQFDFDYSIVFAAFDAEEVGLIGSKAYVASHSADIAAGNILGMVNLDMIAYNPAGSTYEDSVWVHRYESDSIPWRGELAVAMTDYSGLTVATSTSGMGSSDHVSFDVGGVPSGMLIERYVMSNPNYHQPADTMDYLDLEYATDVTRGAVGFIAGKAQLADPPEDPLGVPEPSTWLLAVMGASLLAFRLVRRKSS